MQLSEEKIKWYWERYQQLVVLCKITNTVPPTFEEFVRRELALDILELVFNPDPYYKNNQRGFYRKFLLLPVVRSYKDIVGLFLLT